MAEKIDYATIPDFKLANPDPPVAGTASAASPPLTLRSSDGSHLLGLEEVQTLDWQPINEALHYIPGTVVNDWNTILMSCRSPLVLKLADGTLYTCLLEPNLKNDANPDFHPEIIVKIESRQHHIEIGLQQIEVFPMLNGPNAALLPDEIKCAIVEGYFEATLNHMELFGSPVSVEKVIFNPVETKPLNCLLLWKLGAESGAVGSRAYLGTDVAGLKWLAGILGKIDRNIKNKWVDQIEVPAAMRFGSKTLKLSQIAELDVLDIIVTAVSCSDSFEMELSMYACGSVFCSGKLQLIDRSFTVNKIARQDMQIKNIDQNGEDNTQDTSQTVTNQVETDLEARTRLDELKVEMIFEIGRKSISLGTLKKMTPGVVMDLSSAFSGPVQIYIGGTLFATGQIVQIDNNLGVRLLEIHAKKDIHV